MPVLTLPTRFTNTGCSLIDYMYYFDYKKSKLNTMKIISENFLNDSISDHVLSFILTKSDKYIKIKDRRLHKYSMMLIIINLILC